MADNTTLSITSRLPCDNSRARHHPTHVSTFSSTSCESRVRSRRSARGTPRYRIGNSPIGVDRIREQPNISLVDSPKPIKDHFAQFSRRLEKSEKISIMAESVCAAAQDPWMKKVVSSAYCSRGMPPGMPGG